MHTWVGVDDRDGEADSVPEPETDGVEDWDALGLPDGDGDALGVLDSLGDGDEGWLADALPDRVDDEDGRGADLLARCDPVTDGSAP